MLDFDNVKEYDFNIELDEVFMKKIQQTKEVEYEKFIKHFFLKDKYTGNFIVFDLETTGLGPKSSEIIEIGAIKFIANVPVESFHTFVKPSKKITQEITAINGITNYDVDDAPNIVEVLPHFIKFIQKYTLIAHNVPFDMKFIQHNLYVNGFKKITNRVIDTLALSRKYIRDIDDKKLSSYSLESLQEELCLYYDSHRALEDCKACASVYLECKDIMYPPYNHVEYAVTVNNDEIKPTPDEQIYKPEKNIEIKKQNITSENIGSTDTKKTLTTDEILKTKNIITLTNESGKIKVCSTGFSWTSLLFMYFVPLCRLDFKNFFIQLLFLVLASSNTITVFITPIAYFYFAFTYNKTYIKDLIKKGYVISQ
ncbi:MAG: 3'-5' exonuclease [Peptostreptococcaceae bacterium]